MKMKPRPAAEASEVPEDTLGARFTAARTELGWSVEDAARILRMRPGLVRDLEANNLQNFSHPSYARLSLLDYARLLRLPAEEIRPWLPDPGSPGSLDYQYLEQFADPKPAARREEVLEQTKPALPLFGLLQLLLFLVVIALLASGYILFLNLNRIAPNSSATPEATPIEEPSPAPLDEVMIGLDEALLEAASPPSPAIPEPKPTPLQVDLHSPTTLPETTPAPLTEEVTLEIRTALPIDPAAPTLEDTTEPSPIPVAVPVPAPSPESTPQATP
jgi:cytoskeletal protein RodZ